MQRTGTNMTILDRQPRKPRWCWDLARCVADRGQRGVRHDRGGRRIGGRAGGDGERANPTECSVRRPPAAGRSRGLFAKGALLNLVLHWTGKKWFNMDCPEPGRHRSG